VENMQNNIEIKRIHKENYNGKKLEVERQKVEVER
jgi:hypothetical protein